MDMRKNGFWYNTQDNAFALLAMNKYLKFYEMHVKEFDSSNIFHHV